MDETTLTKVQIRKLNALRRLVGDKLGEEAFSKWVEQQAAASAAKVDPVATKIEDAVAGFAEDKLFKLGNYGYTVRRARGKGASGFVASKNAKPE